ncbi:SdpI family protein [Patescibacteria group bacterium]|nr:SdpI family protein [Patescibacteria group bacterium]
MENKQRQKISNGVKLMDKLSLLLILAMIVMAFYFYGQLPDRVISHWGANGQADGYSSKNFHIYFFPFLTIALYLLFKYLPKIDPKRKNYKQFDISYHAFRLVMIFFFVAMFALTSFINIGYQINMSVAVSSMIGVLFIFIGFIIKDIKQNWFMGIRTPWTLSNENVWKKTHMFAQKIFIFCGFIFIALPYLPVQYFSYYIIAIIILVSLGTYGYSYWLYKKEDSSK